jgi:hypothetical protein
MASPHVDNLTADITKATDVVKSATILVNGIKARIDAAVAAAVANGATEAELAPLSALSDTLETESGALAAAVEANTPAA